MLASRGETTVKTGGGFVSSDVQACGQGWLAANAVKILATEFKKRFALVLGWPGSLSWREGECVHRLGIPKIRSFRLWLELPPCGRAASSCHTSHKQRVAASNRHEASWAVSSPYPAVMG
jgi:hypothetical protein